MAYPDLSDMTCRCCSRVGGEDGTEERSGLSVLFIRRHESAMHFIVDHARWTLRGTFSGHSMQYMSAVRHGQKYFVEVRFRISLSAPWRTWHIFDKALSRSQGYVEAPISILRQGSALSQAYAGTYSSDDHADLLCVRADQ